MQRSKWSSKDAVDGSSAHLLSPAERVRGFSKLKLFRRDLAVLNTNMTGLPMLTAYSASKFAIRGLTQAAGRLSLQY